MPTVYGSWKGSGVQGRIVVTYTRTYIQNREKVNFAGDINIEFNQSISDSTNTWSVSGDGPNSSGSNLAISFGSGGGTKKIRSFDDDHDGTDFNMSVSVSGLEAVGATVNADLVLDPGNLAPFLNNSNYTAGSITQTSAVISGISGNGNGTALVDSQVEYNTSQSDTGAAYAGNTGSYASSRTLTGLQPGTTYYYRVRVENSGYGWSQWGAWKSFTTLATVPTVNDAAWSVTNIAQTTASVAGIGYTSNGGAAVDTTLVRVNTSPTDAGGTDFTFAGYATSMGLTGLLPGTTYYAKVYLHNSQGWSSNSSWKAFTTLPGVSVNVGGVWKNATPYVNVGGVWKQAVQYVNVGGVWKT